MAELNDILLKYRDTPFDYPDYSCVGTTIDLCKLLGSPEPDYGEYAKMDDARATIKAIKEGGIYQVHERVLRAVGWLFAGNLYEPGCIRILSGTVEIDGDTLDASGGNDYWTMIGSDGHLYGWTQIGLRPITGGHDEGKTLKCRS